jgi:superfamily II DNA or RNA helicase
VITTKDDIVGQWREAIMSVLNLKAEEIGIWRGDKTPKFEHKAVIGLVQSISKGIERYGVDAFIGFGLVLCDEVHRMAAEQFSQAFWNMTAKYRLGLTATPERKDGRDRVFHWHIGPVEVQSAAKFLIPKVLMHKTGWKVPRSKSPTGNPQIPHDFGDTSVLLKPMTRNPARNELILKYLISARAAGRSILAFSEVLEHLVLVQELLIASDVPESDIGFYVGTPSEIYGEGGKKAHTEIRNKHKTRPILLATYAMASEATNIPWADTCLLMTPRAAVEQIVGRIRREYENKKDPVVIDLVDNDSVVLATYAQSRKKWYASIGAEIKEFSGADG